MIKFEHYPNQTIGVVTISNHKWIEWINAYIDERFNEQFSYEQAGFDITNPLSIKEINSKSIVLNDGTKIYLISPLNLDNLCGFRFTNVYVLDRISQEFHKELIRYCDFSKDAIIFEIK